MIFRPLNLFKNLMIVVFSFLIFSISINDKLVFDYLHESAEPYMAKSYESFKRLFDLKNLQKKRLGDIDYNKEDVKTKALEVQRKVEEKIETGTQKITDEISEILEKYQDNSSKEDPSERAEESFDEYDYREI